MALGQPTEAQIMLVLSRQKSESCRPNTLGRVQSKTERLHFAAFSKSIFIKKWATPRGLGLS